MRRQILGEPERTESLDDSGDLDEDDVLGDDDVTVAPEAGEKLTGQAGKAGGMGRRPEAERGRRSRDVLNLRDCCGLCPKDTKEMQDE